MGRFSFKESVYTCLRAPQVKLSHRSTKVIGRVQVVSNIRYESQTFKWTLNKGNVESVRMSPSKGAFLANWNVIILFSKYERIHRRNQRSDFSAHALVLLI